MKLIDRYVVTTFIKNYLLSFLVLVGMYIVLDMVFNFDDLVEVQARTGGGVGTVVDLLKDVGDYYFYQMFLFFVHLSGIIPMVAAAFTLMRLSRFNELVAIMAAGVPLLRVAMPIILVGVVLNFVLLPLDQEVVIPHIIYKLTRKHDEIRQTAASAFPVRAMQDDKNGLLMAARYHPALPTTPPWMELVDVLERDDHLQPLSHVSADSATWDATDGRWNLVNGRRTYGLASNDRRFREEKVPFYQSNINPEEVSLYRSGDYVDMLSTERINQLLQRRKSYGAADLLRVKHTRFAQLFLNMILLLLAIPCVLTRAPGQLRMAATKGLILTGLCMCSIFVAHQLAGHNQMGAAWADRWPAMMAWLPIFVFGPISVWLLDRVKT